MKKAWLIFPVFYIAIGCKKKKMESNWSIDNDNYSAVAVPTIAKAITALEGGTNSDSRFVIMFYTGYYLPNQGDLEIGDIALFGSQSHSYAYVTIIRNGIGYKSPEYKTNYIHASISSEKKVVYKLDPTWFINDNGNPDSVLVSGTFYEP